MSEISHCILCRGQARYRDNPVIDGGEYHIPYYDCPRCGRFVISSTLQDELWEEKSDRSFRLACVAGERKLLGNHELFAIFNDGVAFGKGELANHIRSHWSVTEFIARFPEPPLILKRGLNNLRSLSRMFERHALDAWEFSYDDLQFHLFCPRDNLITLLRQMEAAGLVNMEPPTRGSVTIRLTLKAWEEQTETVPVQYRGQEESQSDTADRGSNMNNAQNEVFVVHGRDRGLLAEVCRLIQNLELKPIVLHEQPDKGRTLIEKFEQHANVAYAIVLMSPDDEGRLRTSGGLSPRARQNVIFELGFFFGKLGRERVCALLKGGVEFPSDIDGVLWKAMDDAGAWRFHVAEEMRAAGLAIDLNKLR